MKQEIERKFAVKTMPDLMKYSAVGYERYYLIIEKDFEDRIQKKGAKYEREKKYTTSDLTSRKEKTSLSEEQFLSLKKDAFCSLVRDSYLISHNPEISIKVYHGVHEGLVRAEVEFSSEHEAKCFKPLFWMGKEITKSPLGRDSKLIQLSREAFLEELRCLKI